MSGVILDRAYYKYGEISRLTGIDFDTLKTWHRRGLIETDGRFGIAARSPHRVPVSEVIRLLDSVEKSYTLSHEESE